MTEGIRTVGIAGAGLMGASMAQIFTRWGYGVFLYDISDAALEKGRQLIGLNQKNAVDTGEVTEAQSRETVQRISFTLDIQSFAAADYVVECIVEKMEVKKEFWSAVSAVAPDSAILTTNTSGLSITEIAAAVKRPERFAGMHWVNPPHIVPLVEVIAGEKTAPETLETVRRTALSIHRVPVIVKKDARGFVLNRLQYAVLREALHIVDSGIADIQDVDNVMKYGLGFRYAAIGPFETVDLGGLDTFYQVASYLFADLCDKKEAFGVLKDRYEKGDYGIKTGKGIYDYPGDAATDKIEKRDKDFLKLAECMFGDL